MTIDELKHQHKVLCRRVTILEQRVRYFLAHHSDTALELMPDGTIQPSRNPSVADLWALSLEDRRS